MNEMRTHYKDKMDSQIVVFKRLGAMVNSETWNSGIHNTQAHRLNIKLGEFVPCDGITSGILS